ncbi:MAG TPA: hypothetical protein VFT72_18540 [Opitutaceae bacterium]|nr:hypothetical protein [Opitutaceae bacterium]
MQPDPLEKLIHQTLRSLPDQKAPSSLEARVLAEIARRQGRSARVRSWSTWPVPLRLAFLLLSAGAGGLLITACVLLFKGGPQAVFAILGANPLQGIMNFGVTARATVQACGDLVHLIPPLWLYVGLAAFVSVYGALFGIGATAYRTLWKTR